MINKLNTKKEFKLFCMTFKRRRLYEIINISDIIICIIFLFLYNFIPYSPSYIFFILYSIGFLIISSVTFFVYFYY